jgi:hypothetical protein
MRVANSYTNTNVVSSNMTSVAGRVFNILLNGTRKVRYDGRELIPIVMELVSGYNLLVISINRVKKVTIRLNDSIMFTILLNIVLSFSLSRISRWRGDWRRDSNVVSCFLSTESDLGCVPVWPGGYPSFFRLIILG